MKHRLLALDESARGRTERSEAPRSFPRSFARQTAPFVRELCCSISRLPKPEFILRYIATTEETGEPEGWPTLILGCWAIDPELPLRNPKDRPRNDSSNARCSTGSARLTFTQRSEVGRYPTPSLHRSSSASRPGSPRLRTRACLCPQTSHRGKREAAPEDLRVEQRRMARVARIYQMGSEPKDRQAYLALSEEDRIGIVEDIRREYHGWTDETQPRLQRVYRVLKLQ